MLLASCTSSSGDEKDAQPVPGVSAPPTTLAPPTTTTQPNARFVFAPGEMLDVDERVNTGDWAERPADLPDRFDAWLVQRVPGSADVVISAYLGEAVLHRDWRVTLRVVAPTSIARRTTKFGTAVAEPTRRGFYTIEGIASLSLSAFVTSDASRQTLPVSQPAPIDVSHQVLGSDHLAGVKFGTRDDDAEKLLVARFGVPDQTEGWRNANLGQRRRVRWGSLVAEFARKGAGDDGILSRYSYGRVVGYPSTFGVAPSGTVAGLGTARNITFGSTIAELRASDDRAEIRTSNSGFVGDRWYLPGGVTAMLDRDFLVPTAKVMCISAPAEAGLQLC